MTHDRSDRLRNPGSVRRRRQHPRIPALGAFCTEISDGQDRYSIVSDVSPGGLRLHRPYRGVQSRTVQLEFDLPGVDELIWARGVVCFDRVWRAGEGHVLQTTGIEIASAAGRHLRLLRDYAYAQSPRFDEYAERRAAAR